MRPICRHPTYVSDASGDSLLPFVCDVIVLGSMVRTDGWGVYNELSKRGCTRKITMISFFSDPARMSMPSVHRVASLLKRWILDIHRGTVVHEYLQSCL